MWGQHGDFIIESFSGMRARVKVEAGCMMGGNLSTSFHAVDLGAPYPETGYRSHFSGSFQKSDTEKPLIRMYPAYFKA